MTKTERDLLLFLADLAEGELVNGNDLHCREIRRELNRLRAPVLEQQQREAEIDAG